MTEMKKCPFCAEEILAEAIKCKHCGELVGGEQAATSTTPPVVAAEKEAAEPAGDRTREGIATAGIMFAGIFFAAGLLMITGCSPSGRAASSSTQQRTFTPATPAQVDHVNAFAEEGSGLTLRNAYSAKSEAHESVYFVAAEIVGPGADGDIGVWAHTGTPGAPGMTMSVNAYAHYFCVCPEGAGTAAAITMYDPPASDLRRFVRQRVTVSNTFYLPAFG